jgi:hypothetical protein
MARKQPCTTLILKPQNAAEMIFMKHNSSGHWTVSCFKQSLQFSCGLE